jgi:phenylpyruvate tautomerase PptA (4-oxalocrotonate tautomerase family)
MPCGEALPWLSMNHKLESARSMTVEALNYSFGTSVDQLAGDHPPAEEHVVPFVNAKLVEEVFTERQKHEMAAKLTDVMVAFEGSEAFREVVLVLIEELDRDGWQVGSIENARAAVAAGCDLMAAQGIEAGVHHDHPVRSGTPLRATRHLVESPPPGRCGFHHAMSKLQARLLAVHGGRIRSQ